MVTRPWLAWPPILAVLLGAAILAGGATRFSGPSFVIPRTIAPWWVHGTLFILLGLAQLAPMRPRLEWKVKAAAALPYLGLSVGIAFSAPLNRTVPFTGVIVYGWVGALHLRSAVNLRAHAHA